MHKYFILDTAGGERRQLRTLAGLKAFNRFNQANRTDRNQVLYSFLLAHQH